jgi:hypothetical protein
MYVLQVTHNLFSCFIKKIFKTLTFFYGNRVLKFPRFVETQTNGGDERMATNSDRWISSSKPTLRSSLNIFQDKIRKWGENPCQDSRSRTLHSQHPEYNDHCEVVPVLN